MNNRLSTDGRKVDCTHRRHTFTKSTDAKTLLRIFEVVPPFQKTAVYWGIPMPGRSERIIFNRAEVSDRKRSAPVPSSPQSRRGILRLASDLTCRRSLSTTWSTPRPFQLDIYQLQMHHSMCAVTSTYYKTLLLTNFFCLCDHGRQTYEQAYLSAPKMTTFDNPSATMTSTTPR